MKRDILTRSEKLCIMKNTPLVSVIVPIYNVRKYIETGVRQLLQQDYSQYEILLVDDGATDGSAELCDELATRYDNVFVLHKENGGAGLARDFGVEHTRGEYVYMCDIDDVYNPHLLSHCVAAMEEREADLMMFSFRTVETAYDNRAEEIRLEECEVRSNEEMRNVWREKLLFTRNGNGFVWNKFYRRSFLNAHNLRNAPLRIQQDEEFNLRVMRYTKCVYISSEILYDYYIYESGNNRSRFIPDRFDIYKTINNSFRSLIDFWQIHDKRVEDYVYNRFYGGITQCLNYNLLHPLCAWTRAEKKREFHRIMSDELTRKTMEWKQNRLKGWQERIYFLIYKNELLGALSIYTCLMNTLRSVKHRVANKLNV